MTCRKGCGPTTTSCRPMWSKSFGSFGSFGSFAVAGRSPCSRWRCALRSPGRARRVALADRIQAGDRKAALEMIAKGADVNQAQPDGTTPLHWATYKVDRELVAGADQEGRARRRRQPLRRQPAGRGDQSGQRAAGRAAPRSRGQRQRRERGRADRVDAGGADGQRRAWRRRWCARAPTSTAASACATSRP